MSVVQPIRSSAAYKRSEALFSPKRDFPVWHFAMVNDGPRNIAIESSIAALDLKGKTVVEIGSGTGLIALLFARHGAERVITCEMNENLAAVATRIIAKTPFADRITIINDSSTTAIAQGLLPRAPDVIFTETLDCGVVGEGFFNIAEDIARLAGAGTIIMPQRITQRAVLIESAPLANLNRAGLACGFDLRLLNSFSTGNYFPVHVELHQHRFLGAPHEIRSYTYRDCPPGEAIDIEVLQSGTVHGLLSSFSADFGAASVSNQPSSGSHWHQAFHPLPEEMMVDAGEVLSVLLDDQGYAWITRRNGTQSSVTL